MKTKCIKPIKVPKVPHKDSKNDTTQLVDIYTKLYKERILFLFHILDDEIFNQTIAMLLYLNSENNTNSIYFYINSTGGSTISGLGLYDSMSYINSEILTCCVGISSSISSLILASGKMTKRMILPHSRVMIHQPEGECYGQASDLLIESEEILKLRRLLAKIYVEHTNQTLSKIAKDLDRDHFLSSREAKNYGLVDHILIN
jgi:ATP-dependent Clp protease protease subunit